MEIVMSFANKKREQIKRYILEKIDENQDKLAAWTAETFEISQNTVYRYLRELEKDGIIRRTGREYSLVRQSKTWRLKRSDNELKSEDGIYIKYIEPFIQGLPDNVEQIWQYSFMEMMNNAIDHSEAENVTIGIVSTCVNTTIVIADDGVGIFEKIKNYFGYDSLDDAVKELFKGKLTTDSKRHSGEGIFFTSRALDCFAAVSSGRIFTHDKYDEMFAELEDVQELSHWKEKTGTMIMMRLSNDSNRSLKEVFDTFSDVDGGFTRTRIPVKNIYETFPVSRSQAKRLCHRFDDFEEVELDFDGIDEIGQGFAHEIFVVFQNEHPQIRLIPINTSNDVERMITHVKKS